MHRATVGSYVGGVSYERGTPVHPPALEGPNRLLLTFLDFLKTDCFAPSIYFGALN